MALLLASLPKLAVIRAHVPSHDPYLAAVLQQALDQQSRGQDIPGLLGHLRELYIFAEVWFPAEIPEDENLSDIPAAPLKLDGLWPVLLLQSMRKLHLYDLEADGIAVLIEKNQYDQTCYIDDLLLRTLDGSSCRPADIKALTQLPQALLSFSLFINDQPPYLRKVLFKIPSTDIWEALHEHQKEVRYLDILRPGYQSNPPDHTLGHLGSLQSFSQLRKLRIQLQHLTGVTGYEMLNETNPLLKETLPRYLEAFRLYGNAHCMAALPVIAEQIQELVMGGSHPLLSSITLEDASLAEAALDEDGRTGLLDPGFLQSRITFEPRGACPGRMYPQPGCCCPISQAGICVSSWGQMYEMRVDGNRRFFNIMHRTTPLQEEDLASDNTPSLPYASKVHVLPFTTRTGGHDTAGVHGV
ncbi:hypothetical protein BDV12DRAFT_203236 [Aspergillus spectabilis]